MPTIQKTVFFFLQTLEKYMVCRDYCIANHDDKLCVLPNGRYHIILIKNINELRQKLDVVCFTYQHVDCLYTLLKYCFSGKIVANSGQVFDNVQRTVYFDQRNRWVDNKPSIAKKRLLREKVQNAIVELLPNDQTNANNWISICRENWTSWKD